MIYVHGHKIPVSGPVESRSERQNNNAFFEEVYAKFDDCRLCN